MNTELISTASALEIDSEVARAIRQHARSSMSQEICGVLVGTVDGSKTIISSRIEGKEASQGGAHVTFTQETWNHIYKEKDAKFPNDKIVGWYHSHPGFGVFLSEYDLFIQQNFFNAKHQVAWVFDPHSDEEGCFGWEGDKIIRIENIAVIDHKAKTDTKPLKEPDHVIQESLKNDSNKSGARFNWLVIIYLVTAFLGGALGMFATERYLLGYLPGQTKWNSKDIAERYPDKVIKIIKLEDGIPPGQPVHVEMNFPDSSNVRGVVLFELEPKIQPFDFPDMNSNPGSFPSTKTSPTDKTKSK